MTESGRSQQLALSDNASDATRERVFDFFGLPGELRNAIYSLLTKDVAIETRYQYNTEQSDMDAVVKDKMLVNCLLLNRQFKEEYEQLIGSRQTLIFTDINYNLARVELQGVIKKTSNVKLRLLLIYYNESVAYENCQIQGASMPWLGSERRLAQTYEGSN
jgi:hypothetical protein